MTEHDSNEKNTLVLLNKVHEIDLFSSILRDSLKTEHAALQLNKDLLELIRERSRLLREYERYVTA